MITQALFREVLPFSTFKIRVSFSDIPCHSLGDIGLIVAELYVDSPSTTLLENLKFHEAVHKQQNGCLFIILALRRLSCCTLFTPNAA
jgi:hypothetical protein